MHFTSRRRVIPVCEPTGMSEDIPARFSHQRYLHVASRSVYKSCCASRVSLWIFAAVVL